ncbi:leucyl aminopeptidase [Paenibacillus spongiae]|uniref:Probable cytosol aminopeptidase n=1 Tax=Paenibacillus spongiae TaxID=2909671 RepID=A0ABY5SC13_9BACL|nr:leucyl aminopeptidase [Paenibacillus spongiae]UVI31496.1 leucyl aminopeptidase [Paenibacillus spongiae]
MSEVQFTYGMNDGETADYDVIVKFVSREDVQEESALWVHPQLDAALRVHVEKGLFKAEAKEVLALPTLGLLPASHVIYVGVAPSDLTTDSLRDAATAAAKAAGRLKANAVQQLLPEAVRLGSSACTPAQAAQSMTEGYALGVFKRKTVKTDDSPRQSTVRSVTFTPADAAGHSPEAEEQWKAGIQRGTVFAAGVVYARDLTNLPGNHLTPELLASEAEVLAGQYGMEIEVLDEWTAAEQGMGGLLGVGQGSANPPRMIVIHYEGAADDKEVWGLIGKGITFDTGGISLKNAEGMQTMICDMAGAASVLGVMRIIGELKPKVNILAVIPSAENMPSDRSYKPGDVLKMMNGTTVEVVNTDAEGRLVLADGLTTAIKRGATKLIDLATLTGAVGVALGNVVTGAVTNNDELLQQVMQASKQSGERIWQLPSFPEYRKQLDSDAADMKNSGGRMGGTITGGLFIGAFAEDRPWVHLDIAATAWLDSERSWEPKGGTGVMVRTLGELLTQEQ